MKMNKKGFTLIELLAVIVILAIIALIATPIVLNVVNNAKKSAAKSEARMIVSGIENYCTMASFEDATLTGGADKAHCADGAAVATNIAKMVDLGTATVSDITMDGNAVTAITVTSNGYEVIMTNSAWAEPAEPTGNAG